MSPIQSIHNKLIFLYVMERALCTPNPLSQNNSGWGIQTKETVH
jgi:hypothetical protein